MTDTPFIKFDPSDFLGGTSGLSPSERGVYITLLCLIYENNGPIPRHDSRLSRRCGAPKAAFKKILDGLLDEGKITEADGMLSNNRAEKALMDRTNRTQNATHAANQKWAAQRGKTQQKQRRDDALANATQCASDASQKPEPEVERETNVSLTREAQKTDFDAFWEIVPKKVGKGAARKAFAKAVKIAPVSQIMEAMERYARQREGQDAQYTCHPATWLNQERWTDETAPTQRDFHDEIDDMLKGKANGLPSPSDGDNVTPQQIPSPVSGTGPHGQREPSCGGEGDSRRDQQSHLSLIKPRRFGGAG